LFDDVLDDVAPFVGADLANVRRVDDVRTVVGDRADFVPRGRYAIEDKAGPNAFKLDQARDYARRFDPNLPRRTPGDRGDATGGFRLGPDDAVAEYDGVLYVFARKEDAEAALDAMDADPITRSALRHPGIQVSYFADDGTWKLLPLNQRPASP
jgi:hypothetical protein